MAQTKKLSNTQLMERQQAAARAVQHAETALGQYAAALRELGVATGEPMDWMPSVTSLQNITKGVARRLEAEVCSIFDRAIEKL